MQARQIERMMGQLYVQFTGIPTPSALALYLALFGMPPKP